jgi:L-asparaginase
MRQVWVLGTGGTIAGVRRGDERAGGYTAAVLGVDDLLAGVPCPSGWAVQAEQVASVDSKDMGWATWQALSSALQRVLVEHACDGVVITHGTDTLEETACLLDWLHDQRRPIVLTAAMRPATAVDADGPANLRDALSAVAALAEVGHGGVWVVMQGRLWPAAQVRKAHTQAVDAFDGGGGAPAAVRDASGQWRVIPADGRAVDAAADADAEWRCLAVRPAQPPLWSWFAQQPRPRVECVLSHADADGWGVRAWLAFESPTPLAGVVVACTGHGTMHQGLQEALTQAHQQGVVVWRSSRVARGGVSMLPDDPWPATGRLTAAQARLALCLHLLQAPDRGCVRAFLSAS